MKQKEGPVWGPHPLICMSVCNQVSELNHMSDFYKMLFNKHAFCKNWNGDCHTSFENAEEFLPVFATFLDRSG